MVLFCFTAHLISIKWFCNSSLLTELHKVHLSKNKAACIHIVNRKSTNELFLSEQHFSFLIFTQWQHPPPYKNLLPGKATRFDKIFHDCYGNNFIPIVGLVSLWWLPFQFLPAMLVIIFSSLINPPSFQCTGHWSHCWVITNPLCPPSGTTRTTDNHSLSCRGVTKETEQ